MLAILRQIGKILWLAVGGAILLWMGYLVHKGHTVPSPGIRFVVNGADVMRPGIVEIEAGIAKDEFVTVIDKNNHKPLAVGIELYSSAEMQAMTSGKVIKNIHYVGDELWRMEV